jgi:hypothetical protein
VARGLALAPAIAVFPFAARCALAAEACADESDSLHQSLHYAEKAPDAKQSCFTCGFYEGEADKCGSCKIFNGPTNPKGHCDSWAAKG